jgi:hypothetical protein
MAVVAPPATKEFLLRQADALRDLGRRARRLVEQMSGEGDRRQLERYAEELEKSASRLEREAVDAKTGQITRVGLPP